jgi:chromosome segregation ATPase
MEPIRIEIHVDDWVAAEEYERLQEKYERKEREFEGLRMLLDDRKKEIDAMRSARDEAQKVACETRKAFDRMKEHSTKQHVDLKSMYNYIEEREPRSISPRLIEFQIVANLEDLEHTKAMEMQPPLPKWLEVCSKRIKTRGGNE